MLNFRVNFSSSVKDKILLCVAKLTTHAAKTTIVAWSIHCRPKDATSPDEVPVDDVDSTAAAVNPTAITNYSKL